MVKASSMQKETSSNFVFAFKVKNLVQQLNQVALIFDDIYLVLHSCPVTDNSIMELFYSILSRLFLQRSHLYNLITCRATRRQSLSEIGFGRIDTYTKLDKLGEVSYRSGQGFVTKQRKLQKIVSLQKKYLRYFRI